MRFKGCADALPQSGLCDASLGRLAPWGFGELPHPPISPHQCLGGKGPTAGQSIWPPAKGPIHQRLCPHHTDNCGSRSLSLRRPDGLGTAGAEPCPQHGAQSPVTANSPGSGLVPCSWLPPRLLSHARATWGGFRKPLCPGPILEPLGWDLWPWGRAAGPAGSSPGRSHLQPVGELRS